MEERFWIDNRVWRSDQIYDMNVFLYFILHNWCCCFQIDLWEASEKFLRNQWQREKKEFVWMCVCVCVLLLCIVRYEYVEKSSEKKMCENFFCSITSTMFCAFACKSPQNVTTLQRPFFLSFLFSYWKMSLAIPFAWQILAVISCSSAIHVGASQFVSRPHILYCH